MNNGRPLDPRRVSTMPLQSQNAFVTTPLQSQNAFVTTPLQSQSAIVTRPLKSQNAIVPITYPSAIVPITNQKKEEEPAEIVVYEPEEQHTFLGDVWQGVVKPVGIGIASPVVGAGAAIGSTVVGAGVFVGSCVYGLVSTARGIIGILPIGVDYGVKPLANLVDNGAHGVDNTMGKVLDARMPSWPAKGEDEASTPVIEELPPESPSRADRFGSPPGSPRSVPQTTIFSPRPVAITTVAPSSLSTAMPQTMPQLHASSSPGRYLS